YDWVANGYYSVSYAYMRVFLIPATVTFTGGSLYNGLSGTALPSGAISLDGNTAKMLQSTWTTYSNPIVSVPTTQDYYLVFFWFNSSSSSSSYQPPAAVDNICIDPVSCPRPYNLTKNNLGNGCVELTWTDYGNPQPIGWLVEYGQYGFTPGTGNVHFTTSKPDTICGLLDDVTYDFLVRAVCDTNDTSNYSERIHVRYCSQNQGCIDFTNLTGPHCTCTYGLASLTDGSGTQYGAWCNYSGYNNHNGPYATVGVVDHGPRAYGYPTSQQASRHTVNSDPSIMDSLSNRQLPIIPPTECSSVRLGCAYGSYFCQAITYDLRVDTNNADIILLKYALVVYNPGHPANQQPRFTMQIVDSTNTLIDPVCGTADFNATNAATDHDQPGSPWHSGLGNGVYYRDWTPVGIDVSRYHGHTIRMRFATFNCGQGGSSHFLYAYFTLGCSKARIIANTCGGHAQVATLTAPSGFRYRWYNPSLPGWTSNQQTVQVNIDSSIYYCEVSFIDDTSCKFTMSTMAAPRFPHARFSASLDTSGCNYTVNVTNTSYASISGTDTNRIGACESFYWFWGDGSYSRSENPGSHTYRQPGTYTIMLVVGLAGDECTDTIYQTITFNAPQAPTISGDSVVCINTRAHIQVNGATARRWQWSTGATTSEIDIYPSDSGTVTVRVWDQLGCETDLSFHIDVDTVPLPTFEPTIYESCVPYTLSIMDVNPESSTNTYSWSWGDGSYTNRVNAPTHTYSEVGNFRIRCDIESAEGCYDTVYRMAYVYGYPHGSFSWQPPIITVTNPEVQFINLTTPNPTNTYNWEVFYHTSNPVTYSNTFEPTHRWQGSNTDFAGSNLVRLITTNQVTTQSGGVVSCVDTVENYVLIINDLLQIPNTVTPNGDGINDIFEIKNLIDGGGYTDNELYIYNHWGRMVYHKKNITTREDFWDPSENNDPDGTYYYRFSAKGYLGDILRNGTIQVIR
ncbi:MAG: gliding motility-associated C-terminal domain-containing protein, partial [Bacteroidales bacterium]|nr:gliding motility-associated C-terminal domain-containing protein [Bacteroidales bacterium]